VPATHHLINRKSISRMKPGAVLINTSRGGLVDTDALLDGLQSFKVGGYGMDVYENESEIFFKCVSLRWLCLRRTVQATELRNCKRWSRMQGSDTRSTGCLRRMQ
jgi:lactate dehydrogenase-like 2-hydroxyacid dehydrogenase